MSSVGDASEWADAAVFVHQYQRAVAKPIDGGSVIDLPDQGSPSRALAGVRATSKATF